MHDNVAIEVRHNDGNPEMTEARDMNERPKGKEPPSTKENELTNKRTDSVEWFFKDYTAKDAVSVCEEFLNLMKKLVNNLKIQFP